MKEALLDVIETYYFDVAKQSKTSVVPWMPPSSDCTVYYARHMWTALYLYDVINKDPDPNVETLWAIREKFYSYEELDDRWKDCVECVDIIIETLADMEV